jgi:hypothetical protein
MTFAELADDALDALGYSLTSGTQSEARTRIKRGINTWHRRLLTQPGFARLLRDFEETLTTTTGQAVYGFAEPMGRLNGVYDITNRWSLRLRDLSWLRYQSSAMNTSGTPSAYIPKGWFPVANHPSSADKVYAVSSGSDTTQIGWDFLLSNGQRSTGVTALNGTTAVQLGTASTIVQVLGLTYQGPSTGLTITFTQTSGAGATLGVIQPGRTKARYFQVQLWPTPSASLTYTCDFTGELRNLESDQDEPQLPPDYHFMLSLGAQCEELKRRDDSRYSLVRSDLAEAEKSLNRWLWDLPTPPRRDFDRPSRLGAWFPSGT